MLSDCQTVLHSSMVESDGRSRTFLRKAVKVLRNPRLAAALINAQVRIRGKARLTLSVRLAGHIRLRGDGDVEFGQGVTLMGDVVPIEFVSHKGARISIGDRTFINYVSSISAHKQVKIGCHCLLGHHTFILDNNEHGVAYGRQARLRRWTVDFFSVPLVRDGDAGGMRKRSWS
jgi:acetyltransferase-like isoleucine patch superfamily enzyme